MGQLERAFSIVLLEEVANMLIEVNIQYFKTRPTSSGFLGFDYEEKLTELCTSLP